MLSFLAKEKKSFVCDKAILVDTEHKKKEHHRAVTRIWTWVTAATTQCPKKFIGFNLFSAMTTRHLPAERMDTESRKIPIKLKIVKSVLLMASWKRFKV